MDGSIVQQVVLVVAEGIIFSHYLGELLSKLYH